ncbi:T9SS type A sorting domain-containing protein [Aequorivita lipolytica]|nr:T9SS type A sorting domain-containing protein [Aequorivita lipolytica]SRX53369.1 Internalin-J [Aequorivita lipolytica]
MKNYLFTTILFFSVYVLQAQIVNIPDFSFKEALRNSLCVDTNGDGIGDSDADLNNDGEIQNSEAEAVLWLNVSNKYIEELQGIQSFRNLTYLNCGNNELTELNVSQITSLQEIEFQNNQVTNVNFSQNINLTQIFAHNNELLGLNIKNGNNTILAEIDTSNNTCLGCIRVDDVNYANNASNWIKDANTIYSETCIIDFPDPNFKNGLLNHTSSVIDTNYDGQIQYSEAASVKHLNVAGENITSMVGIAHFCNLRSMYCGQNHIETLDLSHNLKLDFLQCQENNLTHLDVTKCLELDLLNSGSNNLAVLDISQNSKITSLGCSFNQLTSLDVSHMTNLDILSCSVNKITSLTTGSVSVGLIACAGNLLTNIDVSQNPELWALNCENNFLTSIDLSNNINLEFLNVNNNQIFTLDVSPNVNLKTFECESNNLRNLNVSNGINYAWFKMHARNNPNLYCIQVDDETANHFCNLPNNGWCKDSTASYSDFCVLGISDLENSNLQLTPNPVQNIIYINAESPIDHIKIYTLQGQLISESKTNQIDVSQLSSGLYLASISTEGKNIVKKFIKE